jgi:TatD DNase family protein
MIITDTHTHLYSEAFDLDREMMVERAINAGVQRFFVPAIDATYTERMLDLKASYPDQIFLMAGLHPTHVKSNFEDELKHVEENLDKHDYVAIGEIGVDLYWDRTTLDNQLISFKHQIKLAKKHQLPIVIHCRDAFDQVFEVLESEKSPNLKGIFHCFTGNISQAKKAISYNMMLGIGGVVTFKNGNINQFLNQIDLAHIVLETDAPYLSPTPYRGKRNESAYILEILNKVAELYQLPVEEVAKVTTENSRKIFKI